MDVTIKPHGADVELVTRRLIRELSHATRSVGKEIARIGRKAILDDVKGTHGLRFGSKRLAVKTKVSSGTTQATVTLRGAPAGAFTILESGARPHPIDPRRKKALAFNGKVRRHVDHPGARGRGVWTSAGAALDKALGDAVEDHFNDAVT